jgi:hypothetical protein
MLIHLPIWLPTLLTELEPLLHHKHQEHQE